MNIDARQYLLKVERLEKVIQNKADEIKRLQEISTGATNMLRLDGVKRSGHSDKIGDCVSSIIQLENELQEDIERAISCRRNVEKTIEQLPASQYDFLHKVYLQGMNLKEVAYLYDRSYSWATTIHSKALKNLQKVLDKLDA